MQRIGFSSLVHGGAHANQTGGTVQIVLHVLFTAPHQLHWLARNFHGDRHGLACEILRAFASQSTAHLHGEHTHFFLRNVSGRRCCSECGFRILRGGPDIELVFCPHGCAHHGLHGGMGQIRCVVISFHHLAGGQCSQGVTVVACDCGFFVAQAVAVNLHDLGTVDRAVFTVVPFDRHIAQGFFGAPPVVRHHSDEFTQVDDFDDAATVVYFAAVDRGGFAAKDRRLGDGRMQHAGQLNIDAIADLASDDVCDIHAWQRFTCQRPSFRIF